MDKNQAASLEKTEVPKIEAGERAPREAPIFERYVVKVDVTISAGAVPTGPFPEGY